MKTDRGSVPDVGDCAGLTEAELRVWYLQFVDNYENADLHPPGMEDFETGLEGHDPPDSYVEPTVEQIRDAYALMRSDDDGYPGGLEGESRIHRAAHKLNLAHR